MTQLLDQITITLKNDTTGNLLPVYINVSDNSLSRKWLTALNDLIKKITIWKKTIVSLDLLKVLETQSI